MFAMACSDQVEICTVREGQSDAGYLDRAEGTCTSASWHARLPVCAVTLGSVLRLLVATK